MDFNTRFTGPLCLELCPIIKHATHAFVTWIIKNPSYIKGALVLASSLRHHSPGVPRVCLVSEELADEATCNDLRSVFNYVVIVDSIVAEGKHKRWNRFEDMYSQWIDMCFTQLHCLRIGELLGLTRILLIDADVIAVGDLSELFDLPAPAGILSFDEGQCVPGFAKTALSHAKLHGTKLPANLVQRFVRTSYGIRGCLMLLEPKSDDFFRLINVLKTRNTDVEDAIGAYGDAEYHIGPDERLFTEQLQAQYGWTHIHQKFCMTAWHLDRLKKDETPRSLHFVSKKPWDKQEDYFPDFDFWYLEALHLLAFQPELRSRFHNSALPSQSISEFLFSASKNLARFSALKRTPSFQQHKGSSGLSSFFNSERQLGRILKLPPFSLTTPLATTPCTQAEEEATVVTSPLASFSAPTTSFSGLNGKNDAHQDLATQRHLLASKHTPAVVPPFDSNYSFGSQQGLCNSREEQISRSPTVVPVSSPCSTARHALSEGAKTTSVSSDKVVACPEQTVNGQSDEQQHSAFSRLFLPRRGLHDSLNTVKALQHKPLCLNRTLPTCAAARQEQKMITCSDTATPRHAVPCCSKNSKNPSPSRSSHERHQNVETLGAQGLEQHHKQRNVSLFTSSSPNLASSLSDSQSFPCHIADPPSSV